jgi:hypothetical protein
MASRALLADVIKYKKFFYNSSYANYDACLNFGFRLVPQKELLDALQKDFEQMLRSGMFYGKQPSFENVIREIRALEKALNTEV